MKRINKIPEPKSLIRHRANRPSDYNNLPQKDKDELRQNFLLEQGHICCYCMKRIPEKVDIGRCLSDGMKVEHFQCQDNFPELDLTYSNMFGACTGNKGKPKNLETCDTKKGNQELTINLITNSPNCESLFKYNAEGEISSINGDEEINRQLKEVLNLNMETLKTARSEIFLEVQKRVEEESKNINKKNLKIKYFIKERDKWLNKTSKQYKEFCMVAVYYLTKKIRQYHS
jgi:uncharacterized protein (TIGR02646 family)